MGRLNDLEAFLDELTKASTKEQFTDLFSRGCDLLEFSDADASRVFDTSRPNVNRWRRGLVVPPAAALVLRFLREEVEERIKTVRKNANRRDLRPETRPAQQR